MRRTIRLQGSQSLKHMKDMLNKSLNAAVSQECFRNSCSCCSTSQSTVCINELKTASPSVDRNWFSWDITNTSRATVWTGSRADNYNNTRHYYNTGYYNTEYYYGCDITRSSRAMMRTRSLADN